MFCQSMSVCFASLEVGMGDGEKKEEKQTNKQKN